MIQATDDDVTQSHQAGFSAIEAILGVALTAFSAIGLSYAIKQNSESVKLSAVASELSTLRLASDRFIQDNFQSLVNITKNGPVDITVSQLERNEDYLPPSFPEWNAYDQDYHILVRQRSDKVLESLVIGLFGRSMTPFEGGMIASLLKTSGGYVAVGSNEAVGTKGSWSVPLNTFLPKSWGASPSGSAVAYSIHYRVTGPTGSLIRYATGNPADNRMSTDLDMANNSINNVANLKASNVNATDISTNTLTIAGQRLSLSDAQTLSALTAASCGTGYALTKSGSSFYCVALPSMPSGAIAAFEGNCPSDWKEYTPGIGRVFVGAGQIGVSGGRYDVGETGGENAVSLTLAELPNHTHHIFANAQQGYNNIQNYPEAAPNRGAAGSSSGASYNIGANTYGAPATLGVTESVGGGNPFDNRQPFVVVQYCQRQ